MDEQITLITVTRALGNGRETRAETARNVWAGVKSVARSEFYQASQAGMTAELIFKVNSDELGGAEYVEYPAREGVDPAGDRFKILRTYRTDARYTELTCQKMR